MSSCCYRLSVPPSVNITCLIRIPSGYTPLHDGVLPRGVMCLSSTTHPQAVEQHGISVFLWVHAYAFPAPLQLPRVSRPHICISKALSVHACTPRGYVMPIDITPT